MTLHRARVVVAIEATEDLKLCVKYIRIVDGDITLDELLFEWFNMTGFTSEGARRNCIDSIAFFLRCRPPLRDAIMGALDAPSAREVKDAIEGSREKEKATS
jgi:hypothetical protein